MDDLHYVRFEAATGDATGRRGGVFGLVNGLARAGRLTEAQDEFRRAGNVWYDANYADPTSVDPTVYDHDLHPGAAAWFKPSATHLLDRVPGYLDILDAHGIAWTRLESPTPGRIIYEDPNQIVVVPLVGEPT
ncbi:hypothetical protein [Actinokineospora globicatena]|uniref:hypothetical protein n=1 Tax=Actinokineospora globicatena TaxID=103729 RepID=UPI0020A5E099|nr:hypothetical protein [Actinokineospora globicatena]MCP2305044.1 hypothetical protein [Actinokineospora globicatena]GLW80509.1 hypothetical protein Aglo01_49900 [Actinokineospora globicatena]GLW87337.1 hypothetical protein Aglo02_49760 [Actinokineospora globicatena]